jgi:hypothetical protein
LSEWAEPKPAEVTSYGSQFAPMVSASGPTDALGFFSFRSLNREGDVSEWRLEPCGGRTQTRKEKMNGLYEAWRVGKNQFYCYTECVEAHRELTRFNSRYATYEQGGQIIGWQHRVRKSALLYLDKILKGEEVLKNKDLAAARETNMPLQTRSRRRYRLDRPQRNSETLCESQRQPEVRK